MASPWTDSRTRPSIGDRAKATWQRGRDEARHQYERAKREWRWGGFFRWFGIAFGGGIVVLALVLLTFDWNAMRGPASRFVSARLGRHVEIVGNLRVHLFTWEPWLTAEDVHVANPGWLTDKKEMGHADRVVIKTRWLPLIFGKATFPLVQVDRPDVGLVRDNTGRANWDFSNTPTEEAPAFHLPPITQFIINNGHVTLNDAKTRMTFDGAFSSHEQIGGKIADGFALDGKGTLRGLPLTASVRGGPLLHVDVNKPYALNLDVHHGATHVVANGALEKPFDLGAFTAATKLSGPSLADLYFLTGLAMPNTSPYRLSGTFIREGRFYRFINFGGTVGKSDLFGDLSVDASSGRPYLKASLESKSLAFSDLGPLIGSEPGQGTLVREKTWSGNTKTVVSTTRVLPDMPLRVERVRKMDAVVDYKADNIRSQDFPLRQLILHLTLDHGVMILNPIKFTFPQGKLSGKVKIDARGAVPINDVDARITDIQLAQFFGAHPFISGTMEARAKLHAAGDSIHKAASAANGRVTFVVPEGTFSKTYAELAGIDVIPGLFDLLGKSDKNTVLRCAVASFQARGGSLVSEELLVDTKPVQIRGHGTVNLSDESMSFTLQGHPKSFRLIRARAPILIGGTLGNPHIGIQATPIVAQGGLAVAAGALLTPLAAILPFVDFGSGKDANCAALLSDAKAQGAPVKRSAIANVPPPRK